MNKVITSLISIVIFILNPTLWFSFGIFSTSNNSKLNFFLLAFFLGIIGFSIFPWGDGYERFLTFEKSQYFDFMGFLKYGIAQGDVLFYALSYFFKSYDISYQYMQFVFVFLGFQIIFSLFRQLTINIKSKDRFLILIMLLFLINLISLANNMRYSFATILILQAIFFREVKEKNLYFYIIIIIATLTHFYSILLFFLYMFFSRLVTLLDRKKVLTLLFFSFFSIFLLPPIINYIATIISSGDNIFSRKVASYLLGNDGLITKMISSPQQALHNVILQLPLFSLVYYFIKYGNYNCKNTKFFLVFFCFCISFIYFYSVYLRLSYFCLLYGFFLLLKNWKDVRIHKIWLSLFFIFSLFFFIVQMVYFQRIILRDNIMLVNENTVCLISKPIFMLNDCIYTNTDIHNGNTEFKILKAESIQRTMDIISK